MKIIFVFFSFLMLGFTCQKNGYLNKHKWQILGEHKRADYLKGEPIYVKEILQHTPENDINSKIGRQNSYEEYRFNSVGDIIHKRKFISDDFFSDTNFSYDSNGMSYVLIFTLGGSGKVKYDTVSSKSVLLSNGKFNRVTFNKDETKVVLESFLNGGSLVIEEYLKNETHNSDVLLTRKKHYNNDKLMRAELIHKDGSIDTEQYYYSDKGHLDSVVRVLKMRGYKDTDKRVYQYNEMGDYVFYAEISGRGDTTDLATAKYLYDKKGNWIRKLVDQEGWYDGKPVVNTMNEKRYRLLIREIKYH